MTILVVTFTYRGDEKFTRYNAQAMQTLRKLYPQHKILYYIVDDANNPFETPYEDTEVTHYIQSKYDRQKKLAGPKAFVGEARTMDILARKTGADWVVKLDSDTVLMSLDFLDEQYEYIGSNSPTEPKFYSWGCCVGYKPHAIHEARMFSRIEEKFDEVLNSCKRRGLRANEDVLFGYVLVGRLGKKALIQNIGEDKNICSFISDSQTLNPNASAATCKGRFLQGLRSQSFIFTGDKESTTDESVLKRMKQAENTMKARLAS